MPIQALVTARLDKKGTFTNCTTLLHAAACVVLPNPSYPVLISQKQPRHCPSATVLHFRLGEFGNRNTHIEQERKSHQQSLCAAGTVGEAARRKLPGGAARYRGAASGSWVKSVC